MPRQDPPVKWYFSVPKDAQEPQIFFEGDARLYDPQGKPWPEDKTVKGWIALPPAKPGLWAMQPLQNLLVCVRNVPPFFAARDPQNYFEPEIAWRRQTPYQPPAKPAAGATYVPGAIEAPGDQALYLGLGKSFTLAAGPADPAGGGRFLPLNEGTIEFFFKPYWSTFDLPSPGAKCLIRLPADREDWTIAYNKDAQATTWLGSHVLLAYFMTDGAKGRKSMRTYRRALFAGDEWVHVAWVWGPREYARFGGKQTRPILTTRIYVNGRLGQQYPYQGADWDGNHPVGPPKALQLGPDIDAAYDELRVSDIQRYADEFTPPSRERMIQADKNTRALFHFNGDLKGESSGYAGDLPAALK
jgi:hypothetical protein